MAQGLTNAPAGDVTKKDLAQKAEKTHKHSAADITSGTLPVARGGTGNTTGNAATATKLATARTIRTNLGSTNTASFDGTANIMPGVIGTLPIANGGTGATSASAARTALGAFSSSGGTISGNVKINGTVAEGGSTTASGTNAHAEGHRTIASASYSHAEGYCTAASGSYSHAEGYYTKAINADDHAEGDNTVASGGNSHAANYHTKASALYQTAIGAYNKESTAETDKFIIGNGTSDTTRSNCLRVTNANGVYSNSTYKSSGADYAELFQWLDDNSEKEDRVGLFVTLVGERIRIAKPIDKHILGIVSGCPSVLGDVYDDQWKGMYEIDIYGRPIMEEVEVPERKELREVMKEPIYDENGNEIEQEKEYEEIIVEEAHTEIRQKFNPDYDPTQKYIPRSERPEWAVVGMMGKLVAIDDGSCEENGWCTAGKGGIATKSETKTKFRVMKRLDENHIKVLVL